MTHSGALPPSFDATQHVKPAAITTYNSSISYSTTLSAAASSVVEGVGPSAFSQKLSFHCYDQLLRDRQH
jgi:hypothetical protein